MPFLDLALATPRQFVEHVAEAPLDNAENRLLAIFWDENHMIFAAPCGMILVMQLRRWGLLRGNSGSQGDPSHCSSGELLTKTFNCL
jgi:hypothetical protein